MRWANRLFFSLGLLATAAHARGGLCSLALDAVDDRAGFVPTSAEAFDFNPHQILAAAVFADGARDDAADRLPDDADAIHASSVAPNEVFAPTLQPSPGALPEAAIDAFSFSLPQSLLSPTYVAAAPMGEPSHVAITTVAVPLPPAAVAGALAAMTILSGPLLTGRRRRRQRTRPYR